MDLTLYRKLGSTIFYVFVFGFIVQILLLYFYRELLFHEFFSTDAIFPKIEKLSRLRQNLDVEKYSVFMYNNMILYVATVLSAIIIALFRFRKFMGIINFRSNVISNKTLISLFVWLLVAAFVFWATFFDVRKTTGGRGISREIKFDLINVDSYLNGWIISNFIFCSLLVFPFLVMIFSSFMDNKKWFDFLRKLNTHDANSSNAISTNSRHKSSN